MAFAKVVAAWYISPATSAFSFFVLVSVCFPADGQITTIAIRNMDVEDALRQETANVPMIDEAVLAVGRKLRKEAVVLGTGEMIRPTPRRCSQGPENSMSTARSRTVST